MTEQNYSAMRAAMVASQLRTNNVNDARVIAALEAVAREQFVPDDRRALAYIDVAVPLGGGRALNPPMATARLLTQARLSPADRLLIIGAATGYATAVAAQLVAMVTAVEEDISLLAAARANLAHIAGVTLSEAPLTKGHVGAAPYDVILIDGAVEQVGDDIIAQLGEGGRLVCGIVDNDITRLASGVKMGGACRLIAFADAESVRLPGFECPKGFKF